MLSLDKRSCLVGNRRGKFSLTGIMLNGPELNRLLDDEGAWNCWFSARVDGLPAPARWTQRVRHLSPADKFKHSRATLYIGARSSVALDDLAISRATLTPQVGGLTELSITCASKALPAVNHGGELSQVQLDIHTDRDLAAM